MEYNYRYYYISQIIYEEIANRNLLRINQVQEMHRPKECVIISMRRMVWQGDMPSCSARRNLAWRRWFWNG